MIDDLTGMLSASSLMELRRPTSGLMKDEPDEANTRALLEKARKKLCVLANAGNATRAFE